MNVAMSKVYLETLKRVTQKMHRLIFANFKALWKV